MRSQSAAHRSDWGVIWDMDGVLVDTARYHWQAWRELWRELGLPLEYAAFHATFGQRNEEIIARLLGPDQPPERATALGNRKEVLYRAAVAGHARPLPGVLRLTGALERQHVPQAVASSAPCANIDLVLAELGIAARFAAVISGEDVTAGKPDPQVFQLAAGRLGLPPYRCVVIEDAVAGVAAATSAGMVCVAVTNSSPAAELAGASLVVDSLGPVTPLKLRALLRPMPSVPPRPAPAR